MGQYLIGICCAALLCAIVTGVLGNKGAVGAAVKLICGIFMMMTLISPLVDVRLQKLDSVFEGITMEADALAAEGEISSRNQIAAIIKEKSEAYILDKAGELGAQISVEVTLSGDAVPVPVGTHITGNLSPYARKQLADLLTKDLGIAGEEQRWN